MRSTYLNEAALLAEQQSLALSMLPESVRNGFKEMVLARTRPRDMNPRLVEYPYDVEATLAAVPGLAPELRGRQGEVRGALRFFLGRHLDFTPDGTLAADIHFQLVPWIGCAIYWNELDELRRQIKASTFALTSRRIRAAIEHWNDRESASLHLRQAIEVTWWSLYCTYGAQIAFRHIWKTLEEHQEERATYIISADVERYLRGWFAPSENRIAKGLRAVGSEEVYERPPDQVEENDAIIAKQRSVARFFSEAVERIRGERLATAVDRLADAYDYLCGWVHVSPLLVLGSLPKQGPLPPEPSIPDLVRAVAVAAWKLQRALLFDPMWNDQSYLRLVLHAIDPTARRSVKIPIAALEDLRHARKPVEFDLADGTRLSPFPKQKKGK